MTVHTLSIILPVFDALSILDMNLHRAFHFVIITVLLCTSTDNEGYFAGILPNKCKTMLVATARAIPFRMM